MPKDAGLLELRQKVRFEIRRYRSLPEYILDGAGSLLQAVFAPLTRRQRRTVLPEDVSLQEEAGFPSYWLTALLVGLITFFISYDITLISREVLQPNELLLMAWASAAGALALVANKVNMRLFLNTFHGSPLDKILRAKDVEDFGGWLKYNFRILPPFLTGLILGPLLGWFLYLTWISNHPGLSFKYPLLVATCLASIQSIWVVYYFYPFYVSLPARLSRYHYDLYTSDPSSSEVVGRLSQLLTYILYITMAYIFQLTLALTTFQVLTVNTVAIFSLFVWAPTVILYVAGQFHLSQLITRAKWKTLNEIQNKVEKLYARESIPRKDTLQLLEQLMDYHDRIQATPNSALNLRAGLNFLNSLLLPVLAFVAANLNNIFSFFKAGGK